MKTTHVLALAILLNLGGCAGGRSSFVSAIKDAYSWASAHRCTGCPCNNANASTAPASPVTP